MKINTVCLVKFIEQNKFVNIGINDFRNFEFNEVKKFELAFKKLTKVEKNAFNDKII